MADSTNPIGAITKTNGNSLVQDYTFQAQRVQKPTPPASDTVRLSDTARATLLRANGESLGEIAFQLGISVSEVESDLQIAATVTQQSVSQQSTTQQSAFAATA